MGWLRAMIPVAGARGLDPPAEPSRLGIVASRATALRIGRLALVVGVLIGLPLAISLLTGSLYIPHNDAWSHSKIAQEYAATGHMTLLGWNRTSLVGQFVILGPLGGSIAAQHLFVAASGAVSLVMTYLLVRPRAGEAGALLAVITLGVVPDFGLLSTSFMTDIPALAGMLTCLWAGDEAVRRNSAPFWWFGILAGIWAVTVREQAVVAAAAILVAGWLARRPARKHVMLAALVVTVGVVGFEVWRRSLPGDDPPGFSGVGELNTVITAAKILFTVGFYVLPVVVAVANPLRWRPSVRWLAAGATLLAGVVAQGMGATLLLGNYLGRSVSYDAASVGAPVVLPESLWTVVLVAAVLGTMLLVGHALESGLSRDPILLTAGVLLLLGTLAQAAVRQSTSGRFLLLFVPIGAGLLLQGRRVPNLRLGIGVAVLPLVVGVMLTAATYSYDAARWATAEELVAAGVSPRDIDAGFEWVGTHAQGPYTSDLPPREPLGGWYVSRFESSRACHLVTGSPLPGLQPSRVFRYATFGVLGASKLYVYSDRC